MAPSGKHAPRALWQSYSENNVLRAPQKTSQMLQTPENWVSHLFQKKRNKEKNLFCELTVVVEAMSKEPRINVGACISSLLHGPRHAQSKWLLSWPVLSSRGTLTVPCSLASTLWFQDSCKRSLFSYLSAPLPSVLPLSPLSALAFWFLPCLWHRQFDSLLLSTVPWVWSLDHFSSPVYVLKSWLAAGSGSSRL